MVRIGHFGKSLFHHHHHHHESSSPNIKKRAEPAVLVAALSGTILLYFLLLLICGGDAAAVSREKAFAKGGDDKDKSGEIHSESSIEHDISSIKHKETRQSGFTLRGNVPQGPGMGAGAPSASVGLGSRPATIQAGGGTIGKREAILPLWAGLGANENVNVNANANANTGLGGRGIGKRSPQFVVPLSGVYVGGLGLETVAFVGKREAHPDPQFTGVATYGDNTAMGTIVGEG